MTIKGSNTPYLTNLILNNICTPLCFGNLALRFGVESIRTGKRFKGLTALTLGYYAALHNLTYKFGVFSDIQTLHLHVAKGEKSFHAPLLKRNVDSTEIRTGCFFNSDQLLGFDSEKKTNFNSLNFYKKNNLDSSSPSIILDLIHLIESNLKDTKYQDLIFNMVSAYLSDLLDLNIIQKNASHFLGKLTLSDVRNISLAANDVMLLLTYDCERTVCTHEENSVYLQEIKLLLKSH